MSSKQKNRKRLNVINLINPMMEGFFSIETILYIICILNYQSRNFQIHLWKICNFSKQNFWIENDRKVLFLCEYFQREVIECFCSNLTFELDFRIKTFETTQKQKKAEVSFETKRGQFFWVDNKLVITWLLVQYSIFYSFRDFTDIFPRLKARKNITEKSRNS